MRVEFEGCPLCKGQGKLLGESKIKPRAGLPNTLTWLQCESCQHVYTKHYWTEDGLKLLLSNVDPTQVFGGDLETQRAVWSLVIERCPVKSGRWVDIGCGNGSLVTTATEYGFDAIGIDIRPEPVAALVEHGYKALQGDAYGVQLQGADVVSLADVLEHVPDPRALLWHIRKQVADGAVLFVSCPNMDTAVWVKMQKEAGNPYWVEPEHYHNFTRFRLQRLLRECGWEPFDYSISRRYSSCMEIFARAF